MMSYAQWCQWWVFTRPGPDRDIRSFTLLGQELWGRVIDERDGQITVHFEDGCSVRVSGPARMFEKVNLEALK